VYVIGNGGGGGTPPRRRQPDGGLHGAGRERDAQRRGDGDGGGERRLGSGYSYTLKVDGTTVPGTGPTYSWDTKTIANGAHTLTATVTDSRARMAAPRSR